MCVLLQIWNIFPIILLMQSPKNVEEKLCKFGACAATNLNFLSSHSSTDEDRVDWNNVVDSWDPY